MLLGLGTKPLLSDMKYASRFGYYALIIEFRVLLGMLRLVLPGGAKATATVLQRTGACYQASAHAISVIHRGP